MKTLELQFKLREGERPKRFSEIADNLQYPSLIIWITALFRWLRFSSYPLEKCVQNIIQLTQFSISLLVPGDSSRLVIRAESKKRDARYLLTRMEELGYEVINNTW